MTRPMLFVGPLFSSLVAVAIFGLDKAGQCTCARGTTIYFFCHCECEAMVSFTATETVNFSLLFRCVAGGWCVPETMDARCSPRLGES